MVDRINHLFLKRLSSPKHKNNFIFIETFFNLAAIGIWSLKDAVFISSFAVIDLWPNNHLMLIINQIFKCFKWLKYDIKLLSWVNYRIIAQSFGMHNLFLAFIISEMLIHWISTCVCYHLEEHIKKLLTWSAALNIFYEEKRRWKLWKLKMVELKLKINNWIQR